MSMDALLTVLPEPLHPLEAAPLNWLAIEEQLGLELPGDYKMFIKCYGTGCIGEFLWILNPISKNPHLNLLHEINPITSALMELKDAGESCPYLVYPEKQGLLPFGKTDNGDILFWLTKGLPKDWPVILNAGRDPSYERYECDMTDYLAGILTRRIRSSILPAGFPGLVFSFTAKS